MLYMCSLPLDHMRSTIVIMSQSGRGCIRIPLSQFFPSPFHWRRQCRGRGPAWRRAPPPGAGGSPPVPAAPGPPSPSAPPVAGHTPWKRRERVRYPHYFRASKPLQQFHELLYRYLFLQQTPAFPSWIYRVHSRAVSRIKLHEYSN